MSIFWYEQSCIDVPDDDSWLSEKERSYVNGLSCSKRREDWRLGRWTAKSCVSAILGPSVGPSLSKIEIWPGRSGAPMIFVHEDPALLAISLSHSGGKAVCALGAASDRIGCDIEIVEPRDAAFVSEFFSADEQAMLAEQSKEKWPLIATLLWSAKESALKALHWGLRLDTRCLEVSLGDTLSAEGSRLWLDTYPIGLDTALTSVQWTSGDVWHPFQVKLRNVPAFLGWWRSPDQFVRTLLIRHPDLSATDSTSTGTSSTAAA